MGGLDAQPDDAAGRFGAPARRRLWWLWVVANGVGEALGLGGAAVAGVLVLDSLRADLPTVWARLLSAVVFGVILGAVVGLAQATVLRWPLPFLRRRTWVAATTLGGTIGWLAVSVPLLDQMTGRAMSGLAGQLVTAAGIGLVAGPILGVPQWAVLREHVPQATPWIWANTAAWTLGAPAVVLAAGSVPTGAAWYVVAALALPGLSAAGAMVGAIHGLVLVRLVGYRLEPNVYAHRVVEELGHTELRYGRDDEPPPPH